MKFKKNPPIFCSDNILLPHKILKNKKKGNCKKKCSGFHIIYKHRQAKQNIT